MGGNDVLNRALTLAGHGFLVFPCRSDKSPATLHGFKDASKYAERVRELWRKYPGTLVGIACGHGSDLAVLDLDRKHPEAHAWWTKHRLRLPTTYTVRTRSGGLHLYYRHRPGLTCSVGKIAPGVDVRAEGGYAIAWAEAGCPVLHNAARADWPDWLSCLTQSAKPAVFDKRVLPRVPDNHMLAGLVRRVAHAREGERNSVAFWAARRMGETVRSGMIGEAAAIALIEHAAVAAGLPQPEARRTAESGIKHMRVG
jgi:Bifunctional DNA primase/polymerase, N-terminal